MTRIPPQKGLPKSLSETLTQLKRDKMVRQQVVDLNQYRESRRQQRELNLLVVDTDDIFREALKRTLEIDSYRVRCAADAMELSEMIEQSRIDLILLGIDLPWVNGLELCGILKSHPQLRIIPVVIVAPKASVPEQELISQSGCDGFLVKPFDRDTLTNLMDRLIVYEGIPAGKS